MQQTESPPEKVEKLPKVEEDKSETPVPETFKDYLQSFNRRNSDTNYVLGRNPTTERINLADEIRKLSDHLLMLSEINTKLEKEIHEENDSKVQENGVSDKKTENITMNGLNRSQSCVDDDKMIFKSTTFMRSSSVIRTTPEMEQFSSSDVSSSNKGKRKVSMLSIHLQSLDETPKITPNRTPTEIPESRSISPKVKTKSRFTESLTFIRNSSASDRGSGVPWPVTKRRAKFRVNQMSRDVPVGSPDTHQPFNLEDANTTKDCLLHLLEKYHDTRTTSAAGFNGRHSSISFDWNMSDNLEQKSMSSINAFFRRHATQGRNVQQLRAQLETKSQEF